MALPVVIPNTFANANASIPLSQLDNNFSTVAVSINGMANGAEALANVNITGGSIANASLSNVSISSGNVTINVANVTTLDATNVEVTNIKAKDGTASATIADSTGVMTIGSSVLTTTDINGGTIDATAIGGGTPAAGQFSDLATTGNLRIGTTTNSGAGIVNLSSSGAIRGDNTIYIDATLGNIIIRPEGLLTVGTFSSTGLAVTGAITATGAITGYSNAGATFVAQPTAPTSAARFDCYNSGGIFYMGLDGSGGGLGGPYTANLWHSGNYDVVIGSNNAAVARFNSTGLAVTGAITASTSLTVTGGTITTGAATQMLLQTAGSSVKVQPTTADNGLLLVNHGSQATGIQLRSTATERFIETTDTVALSLATSGGTQVTINNLASTVNSIYLRGSTTTAPVNIYSTGSDTNVGMAIGTQGSGSITLRTDVFSSAVVQAAITHTASANRYITLTGSNGGNPTIGTSAGSLLLAPAGATGLRVSAVASQANYLVMSGTAATGSIAELYAEGSDSTITINYASKGAGSHNFYSDIGTAALQFAVIRTASANRYITVTGSNGGNPTISTSAGSLAITPNIVCSGAVYTGSSNNAGIENNYAAVAADGNLDLPKHVNGGIVVIRDNSSGGTALAIVDEATGVTIVNDPNSILSTTDPGAGGNKFWLQSSSGSTYTRITNRFSVTKNIGFTALATVMVGP